MRLKISVLAQKCLNYNCLLVRSGTITSEKPINLGLRHHFWRKRWTHALTLIVSLKGFTFIGNKWFMNWVFINVTWGNELFLSSIMRAHQELGVYRVTIEKKSLKTNRTVPCKTRAKLFTKRTVIIMFRPKIRTFPFKNHTATSR